jgi:hypothetical protein
LSGCSFVKDKRGKEDSGEGEGDTACAVLPLGYSF